MKIALLESAAEQRSATGVRGRAMRDYLRAAGHHVDVLTPGEGARARFLRRRMGIAARLRRRLLRRPTLPHLWDDFADRLEPQLRRGSYDLVIGRGQEVSAVFARKLGVPAWLDMANVVFLEEYYSWSANPVEVAETFAKESAILRAADAILSPHALLSRLLLEHFPDDARLAAKTHVVALGCEDARRVARWSETPRVVYAGSYYYIQDPYLLSLLARRSPIPIHCYGPTDPNRPFLAGPLDYRGYAPEIDFLADYQFGLITVSRDRLRQFSPATKLPYYLGHGLPVLFPEWVHEGHDYPDCAIPYSEETFADALRAACEPGRWAALHAAALARAAGLTWSRTLRPLDALLAGLTGRARTP